MCVSMCHHSLLYSFILHSLFTPLTSSPHSQRAFEPPEVQHDRLMVVSVAGFVVNLIGIFAFHHGGSGRSHDVVRWYRKQQKFVWPSWPTDSMAVFLNWLDNNNIISKPLYSVSG